jgi:hypothetical protein
VDDRVVLLVTVALLTLYVIGVGGTTAAAIGVRESWRRLRRATQGPDLTTAEVVLNAPSLPRQVRVFRLVGWIAFPFALALGIFDNPHYPWVLPATVIVTVALNAFYFSATRGLGEPLTLTSDGFRIGDRKVRWVHVTDLVGGHMNEFRSLPMPDKGGEWRDPKGPVPNVVFYRLNRALVRTRPPGLLRLSGHTYYDGIIRNHFGVATDQLLHEMRERRQRALDAEGPPLSRRRSPAG